MNGLCTRGLAGGDDLVDQEIAFGSGRRPDMHRLIGHLDMQGIAIGVGIDRHRLDAHPAGGLDDPASDFAAIGDQDTLEHAAEAPSPGTFLRCNTNVNSDLGADHNRSAPIGSSAGGEA